MKNLSLFFAALLLISFSQLSFAGNPQSSFDAQIDGVKFNLKKNKNYTAQLSPDGKTIQVTFYGNEVRDKQGHVYPSKLQVAYHLNEKGITGVSSVLLDYNNQQFADIANANLPVISKIKWNKNKTGLVLSADFNCKLQSAQTSENLQGIVLGVQGNVENIRIQNIASEVAVAAE